MSYETKGFIDDAIQAALIVGGVEHIYASATHVSFWAPDWYDLRRKTRLLATMLECSAQQLHWGGNYIYYYPLFAKVIEALTVEQRIAWDAKERATNQAVEAYERYRAGVERRNTWRGWISRCITERGKMYMETKEGKKRRAEYDAARTAATVTAEHWESVSPRWWYKPIRIEVRD